jgi:hypothetical protein
MNKEVKKILEDKFDYDFDSEIFTDEILTIIDETIQATTLQLLQPDVSNAKRTLAIKFADALLNDFEMTDLENGDLRWSLCGTPTKMTTDEVYDRYIDEILANDC